MKFDNQSFNTYLKAKQVAERVHTVYTLNTHGINSQYETDRLLKEFQDLRAALYEMGVL
jgi:hypothetical protein